MGKRRGMKRDKNEIRDMVKKEIKELSKISLNSWLCDKCGCEWSLLTKFCRKCELKVRKARRKESYLRK